MSRAFFQLYNVRNVGEYGERRVEDEVMIPTVSLPTQHEEFEGEMISYTPKARRCVYAYLDDDCVLREFLTDTPVFVREANIGEENEESFPCDMIKSVPPEKLVADFVTYKSDGENEFIAFCKTILGSLKKEESRGLRKVRPILEHGKPVTNVYGYLDSLKRAI